MASVRQNLNDPPAEIQAAALYGTKGPVKMRIATGGAGQTGVLKVVVEAFIEECVLLDLDYRLESVPNPKTPSELKCTNENAESRLDPFQIAWISTDTSLSFNALATRAADIAITYHPYAETIALKQGIACSRTPIWRDAFCFVGPISNPANLPSDGSLSVYELFAWLFQRAVETAASPEPVRFLSRYDKSANNILESRIWTSIGQTPWSHPYSTWYKQFVAFPKEALCAAAALEAYTLVDRGTWYNLRDSFEVRDKMQCYKEGNIEGPLNRNEEDAGYTLHGDHLSNPAHALVSPYARDFGLASRFLDWMTKDGQRIIRSFQVGGCQLHGAVNNS